MEMAWLVCVVLGIVIALILWRPWHMNEAIPAACGAIAVIAVGAVSLTDLRTVVNVVSSPGITIISTMIMSRVLDAGGFFRWAAVRIAQKARGSGTKLFFMTLFLCFCMTLFFNNDGSVLITTPIILEMTRKLGFTKREALPYLLGGVLIASSSSAPIGVSNLANLIALGIVGLNLNQYAVLMVVPSILGIGTCVGLLYLVSRRKLPKTYQVSRLFNRAFPPKHGEVLPQLRPLPPHGKRQQSQLEASAIAEEKVDRPLFVVGISVVVLTRFGFFVGVYFHVSVQYIAIAGALLLLLFMAIRKPRTVAPILKRAPWYILIFAFGMYTIVYALHDLGLTALLGRLLQLGPANNVFWYMMATGVLLTVMSCIMNNLPSVMIGTTMLTDLHLHASVLKLAYLSNILGSDIGSLLLPMGTLASLMWFHIVSTRMKVTWADYIKVSLIVIPPSLLFSLLALYVWGNLILR